MKLVSMLFNLSFIPILYIMASTCSNETEETLHHLLLQNYDKRLRPILNYSSVVNVTYTASLYQLAGFDVKAETMATLLWQRMYWKDEHLTWDPAEHSGITVLRFGLNDLWRPDILPFNEIGVYDVMKYRFAIPLKVRYDGLVGWLQPAAMTTTCTMDVSKFPFDTQSCQVVIGSWQYNSHEVDIHCGSEELNVESYSDHTQWKLRSKQLLIS